MKFGLSVHVQLPLPADGGAHPPDAEGAALRGALELVEAADRLGYDYVFVVEHHFLDEYCLASAPDVLLAWLAGRTRRIRLGFGVVQLEPGLCAPAKVAGRLATLDQVSGGRVEFGAGSVGNRHERALFGLPPVPERGAWKELAREILDLLAGRPAPGSPATGAPAPATRLVPGPAQRPHPPVWCPAATPEAVRDAGCLGIGALGVGGLDREAVTAQIDAYWKALASCREPLGRALNPATAVIANMLCMPTREAALEAGAVDADYFPFSSLEVGRHPRLADAFAKARTEGRIVSGPAQRLFLGSPADLTAALLPFEAAHLDLVLFQVQTGRRPWALALESMERFAREVMPAFAARHPHHQAWRAARLAGVGHPVVASI